ncbi:MAG: hypothetical protein A4S17_14735 [Proteobacteria bacterium HN_bin10]|nr:MAG: hypothetical protein A4S17_14735 [Proteobacteria bacterium HN_bin10]
MAEHDPSRTEQATGRRKAEAKKHGQIALSREVPTAAVLLGGILLIYATAAMGSTRLTSVMRQWFGRLGEAGAQRMTSDTVHAYVMSAGVDVLTLVLPVALGITVLGVAAYGVQTGLMVFPDKLNWDFGKINPLSGFSRLFSLRSVVELVKSVLKVAFIAGVGVLAVRKDIAMLPSLVTTDIHTVLGTTAWLSFKMAIWVCGVIGLLAAADYAYQRFEWERSLRMTKEEVKQEHKETEGDPILRSRIRGIQRSMARKRMMAAVPKADVVITNPTHLAVAIQYDQKNMAAPVVVAKGAGYLAEKIKEVAREARVPVVENKFVARTLYTLVEIGKEIPADLYRAVAEILAVVYRAKGKAVSA